MPESEPNKRMDALLRAYAKRVRPGVQLYQASRRALQEEVKKVYGGGEAKVKKGRFWPAWWIRWPVAAGLAAWAVLLVVNNRRFEEGQARSRQAANFLAARKSESLRREPEMAAAPPAPSAAPMALAPAAAPMSAAPSGAAKMIQGVGGVAATADLMFQSGQQLFQNSAPAQQVLNNFRVQREGERVLVTDGDGSVYAGNVVSPDREALGRRRSVAAGEMGEMAYGFAVRGTNRSLQQSVSFKGNLANAAVGAAQGGNAPLVNQTQNAPQAQNQAARVTGTVTVGGTNQYRVEATAPSTP